MATSTNSESEHDSDDGITENSGRERLTRFAVALSDSGWG